MCCIYLSGFSSAAILEAPHYEDPLVTLLRKLKLGSIHVFPLSCFHPGSYCHFCYVR
jgi:hypothetical protein